jgi:hypothetical protein
MSQTQLRLVAGNPAANTVGKMPSNPQSTTKAAALKVLPRTGTQRAEVLDAIIGAGVSGMTDAELQRSLTMNPNTERPRRVELVEGGWITDSGQRRVSAGADLSIVWALSVAGRQRLINLVGGIT